MYLVLPGRVVFFVGMGGVPGTTAAPGTTALPGAMAGPGAVTAPAAKAEAGARVAPGALAAPVYGLGLVSGWPSPGIHCERAVWGIGQVWFFPCLGFCPLVRCGVGAGSALFWREAVCVGSDRMADGGLSVCAPFAWSGNFL